MATIVQWKDLSERLCVLTIGDGQSGTSQLDAGAEPFVTDVQDDDDIFTPVRSGSGYVRVVVDEADDVSGLVGSSPLERPVVLTVGGVTRWKGFLSCESFTQAWDKGPLELELPVLSGLGVIGGLYPSSYLEDLGYINFAQFLCDMNAALGGIYANFYFSAVSEPQSTLKYQFRMANYATAVDKNTRHEVATYGEILEDVCKLFGWCAVEYADSLVLLTADVPETDMIRFTASQLEEFAAGSTSSPTSAIPYASAEAEIFGTGHNRSFLAGKKRVEVSGDLNEMDETIWEMDVFQQCEFKGNNYHSEMAVVQPYYRYTVKKMGCVNGGNIEVYNNVYAGGAGLPDTDGNNIKYAKLFLGATNAYGASITYEQFAEYANTLPFKTIVNGSLDFHQRFIIKAYSAISLINVRIATNFFYDSTQNQQYDAFRINAAVKYAANAQSDFADSWGGQKYLEVSLVIKNGNTEYYYSRSDGWSTDGGKFMIYCSEGKIDEASYNSIPAPSGISGEVILYIWSDTDGIGDGFIAIENLSIQLYAKEGRVRGKQSPRVELDELRDNQNVKTIDSNNGFTETWDSECGLTLAREAVPDSYGVVLDGNRALPASLYGNMWPEDALAERAQKYFSKAREKVQAVVKSEGAMLDPMKGYELVSGGRVYALVGQSVNWKTNEINGLFFEQSETEE